jgi:hypothetical protein
MTLTYEEMAERNLKLIEKRLFYIANHLGKIEAPLDRAQIIELPRNDPELLEANLEMATDIARRMMAGKEEIRPIVLMPEVEEEPPIPEPEELEPAEKALSAQSTSGCSA